MIKGAKITVFSPSSLVHSLWLSPKEKNKARCIAVKGDVYKEDQVIAIRE